MKHFVKNTLLFVGLLIVLIVSLFFGIAVYIRSKANFKIDPSIQYAAFGHSHPECALNDTFIHNFKNFGKSGESYYYTYFKLREVLKQNTNIKTVFIEFGNNQIELEMNPWIWGEAYMAERYSMYLPFMNKEDLKPIYTGNKIAFFNYFSFYFKDNLYRIATSLDYSRQIAGYLRLDKDKVDSFLALNQNYRGAKSENQTSKYNIFYLQKIIKYCNERNKKVVFIRCPVHPNFPLFGNEAIYQNILHNKFTGIEFADFKDFKLNNDEFADLEHLNYKGAKRFSIWFDEWLRGK